MQTQAAVLALLWAVGRGMAQGAAGLPVVRVAPIEQAPVIDGTLSEACWQRPADARNFTVFGGGTPAAEPTEVWLARDDAWLFLAAVCHGAVTGTAACVVERDGEVLRDDALAVFLSPGTDGATGYEFAFNARGVQADSRAEGPTHSIPWDAHWRTATAPDPERGGWAAEAAIPLFYLADTAGAGRWRVNVVRRRPTPPESSSWAALPGPGWYAPEHAGVLEGLAQVKAKPVFAPVITSVEAGPYVDIPRRFYEVKVGLYNPGGAPGALAIQALDITPAGQTRSARLEQALGPGVRATATIPVDIEDFMAARETRVLAALTDRLGAWEWPARADRSRAARPLRAAMDRSYYTDEPTAHLVYGTSLPRAALEGLRLRVQVRAPGAGAVTGGMAAAEGRVALPLAGLPPGTYDVEAGLLGPDGSAFEHIRETCRLIKRDPAPAGNEVKTDRWNHCLLVNGKPFFSLGYCGAGPESFGMLAGMGFNTVLRWNRLELPDLAAYLDAANRHGLFVVDPPDYSITPPRAVYEPTYAEKMREGIRDKLPAYLATVKAHPALLAYYGPDEPGLEVHKVACHAMAAALNAGDGRHPNLQLFCHYFPTAADWLDFWDVGALDIYRYDSPSYLSEAVLGKATTDVLQKPYWLVPMGESCSGSLSILPPRQQRSQTYLSLIHGACGITYFIWPVSHVDTYAMFKTLAAEIHRMAPALLTRGPPQTVRVEPAGARNPLQVRLKAWPEGGQILLAANIAEAPVAVRYAVSSLTPASTVSNLFGAETWPVTDGGFSDRLEALGTRVYRLAGTASPEPVAITLALAPEPAPAAAPPAARGPAARSKNILPNSSFEHATLPGMPDMWLFMPWRSYTEDTLVGKPDALVALDEADPFDGRVSVRLRGIELVLTRPSTPWKWAQMVPMKPETNYVFSIHMKADRDDVEVSIWRGRTEPTRVRVGRQWGRYACVGGNKGGLQMRITTGAGTAQPGQAVTVWLDAAQLEPGTEPTPYVRDAWAPE